MLSFRKPVMKTVVGILAISVALAVGFFIWTKERTVSLPDISEIDSATAECMQSQDVIGGVAPFEVPQKYFPAVLNSLRPAKVSADVDPGNAYLLGKFTIRTKAGKTIQVDYCFHGKNPLAFRVDGMQCYRSGPYKAVTTGPDAYWVAEASLLARLVSEIDDERRTGKTNNEATALIQDLERSRGDRPPQ